MWTRFSKEEGGWGKEERGRREEKKCQRERVKGGSDSNKKS
jgi:hypothetical protein